MQQERRRGWRGHAVDALLGLLVTGALLACIEGGLWAMGVRVDPPIELSRGFDPDEAYVFPDPEHPGAWRTRIGTPAIDNLSIPPHSGAVRVCLFGGSNTRAFAERDLLDRLVRAGTGHDFEVYNLGRPGYGSGRVAILFEQALARLEPDVVVLYIGHNEFVERSFSMDMRASWSPLARALGSLAQRTRVARLLRDVALGVRPRRHSQAGAWRMEYGKFHDLTYAETLAQFDAYEANLRRMVELARARGAHVVLSTLVYNRWSPPYVPDPPVELGPELASRVRGMCSSAERMLPEWVVPLHAEDPRLRINADDWRRHKNDVTEGGLPGLRPLIGPLAGRTPLFPAGDRTPVVARLYAALERLHAGAQGEDREAFERSAALLDETLALAPDYARALFLRALVAWGLGRRDARTAEWFEDSARFDRGPRKATALVNDHVRALAAEFPGVVLVDLDVLFRGTVETGTVGWELMTDHCHLGPLGRRFAVVELADAVVTACTGGGR